MSDDFLFALAMLAVGLIIIATGATYLFRQKVYFNPADNSVTTEVDIPLLGKLKTNAPAIVLCFLGLLPVVLAYNTMKGRAPTLVTFKGEVLIDQASLADINAVMVGITSGLWSATPTPNGGTPTLPVTISVPDSWPSYTAYAFALGGPKTRPAIIGTNLNDPKFSLRIAP